MHPTQKSTRNPKIKPKLLNAYQKRIFCKNKVDFLLTELTQLLEASSVQITSLHLERQHEEWIEIMLTIDAQDLKHLLPTLRRFGYEVMSKHKEDDLEDKLQDHASYLDKYLSM